MKKIIKYITVLISLVLILSSCESTDLDLLNDPHSLTPDSASPNYVLNSILINGNAQVYSLSGLTKPVIRQTNQFGLYTNVVGQESMTSAWYLNYTIMNNLNTLKEISANKNLPHHVAMGEIVNAMTLVNLVDYIGTAIYSEAVNSAEYPNPGLDDGEYIYNEVYTLLYDAISKLHENATYTQDDLYYHGDIVKWEKLANSLIIKMLVQSRKATGFDQSAAASKINEIVSSGMYMKDVEDDFQYNYGVNQINPDSRHPLFTTFYVGSPNTYMSNDFMLRLMNNLDTTDPRLNAYIYRQTDTAPTGTFITDCTSAGFSNSDCYIGGGYWGRLHADESGIPNDNKLRATYGAYPIGGAYDDANFTPIHEGLGDLKGAGINPILTSSNINFLLAEAVLTISGVNGDALNFAQIAVENSFQKVSDFTGRSLPNTADYINFVVDKYNNSTSIEDKLELIINQNYLASFGNGIEPYNAYRRTGFPTWITTDFQDPGAFPRSMFIPKSELDSNENSDMVQKTLTDQVFWDTNPAGFIE